MTKKMTKKTTKKTAKKVVVKAVDNKPSVETPKKRGRPPKKVVPNTVATEAVRPVELYASPFELLEAIAAQITPKQKASYDANGTFLEEETVAPMTVNEERQLEEYLENLKKDRLVLANSNKSWLTKVWEFLAQLFPNW